MIAVIITNCAFVTICLISLIATEQLMLVTLQPGCPEHCICQDNLTLIECSNTLDIHFHFLPPQIRELIVTGNLLGPVFNRTLSNLVDLQVLDFSNNGIAELAEFTLTKLNKLQSLSLRNNKLMKLEDNLFQDTPNLQELDISHNRFSVLPNAAFRNLQNLRLLNMSYNRLTDISLGLRFQVMTRLQILDFSRNNISLIPVDAFAVTQRWRSSVLLNLSYCDLRVIEPGALQSLQVLERLVLAGNTELNNLTRIFTELRTVNLLSLDLSNLGLTDIENIFDSLQQASLTELNLANNNISVVKPGTFAYLQNLKTLTFSNNMLSKISADLLNLGNLEYLDLSCNNITTVEGSFEGKFHKLAVFLVAHNRLGPGPFELGAIQTLQTVDVSYNGLGFWPVVHGLENLKELFIAGNNLINLPSLSNYHNLTRLDVSTNRLISLGPFLFHESGNIAYANFSGNLISSVDHRAFQPKGPSVIDISHNRLSSVHNMGWHAGVRAIYLQGNSIVDIDEQTFLAMHQLQILDLSSNNLTHIFVGTLAPLSNLSELYLHGNLLGDEITDSTLFQTLVNLRILNLSFNNFSQSISPALKQLSTLKHLALSDNRFTFVPLDLLESLPMLETVDLSKNPYTCDCSLLPFRNWLRVTKVEVVPRSTDSYTCSQPLFRRGHAVPDFEVKMFECRWSLFYIIVFSSVGGLLMLVAIVTAIVCQYYHRWRQYRMERRRKLEEKYKLVNGYTAIKSLNSGRSQSLPVNILLENDRRISNDVFSKKGNLKRKYSRNLSDAMDGTKEVRFYESRHRNIYDGSHRGSTMEADNGYFSRRNSPVSTFVNGRKTSMQLRNVDVVRDFFPAPREFRSTPDMIGTSDSISRRKPNSRLPLVYVDCERARPQSKESILEMRLPHHGHTFANGHPALKNVWVNQNSSNGVKTVPRRKSSSYVPGVWTLPLRADNQHWRRSSSPGGQARKMSVTRRASHSEWI